MKKETKLTHKAVGSYKNKDGFWCIAVIDYNPETGDAKIGEVVKTESIYSTDRDHHFKVTAANLDLVG